MPSLTNAEPTAPASRVRRILAAARPAAAAVFVTGALGLTGLLGTAGALDAAGPGPLLSQSASAAVQASSVSATAAGGGNPKAYAFLSQTTTRTPIARWNPCVAIPYRVNVTRAPAGGLADVQESVKRISAATGLTFSYKGTTGVMPGAKGHTYPKDTQLIVGWARPGETVYMPARAKGQGGPAGQGGASWVGAKDKLGRPWGKIVQGYVVLDATLPLAGGFGAGPTSGWQGTRGQLIMHEMGHAIGLDHPKINDQVQIMYPTLSRKQAVWGAGDLNGLRVVGRSSGCL